MAIGQSGAPSVDPMENRIAIVRATAERQRTIQKAREDTMRFISHDIRSPLASIITLAEGSGRQAGVDQETRLRQAGHYAQIALTLADDFFRLAKAEAIDKRKFVEIDLSSLAQEAADQVWPLADAKHILIFVRDDVAGDALVLGDHSLLSRALTNLLSNAIKYSPADTEVNIDLRATGNVLEVAIADQGYGIAPADLDRLFVRYGRVKRADQPAQPGVGLGLVIVKTIVERHGGSVTVTSALGAGSTFLIRLPRAKPAE
jgi:hypothetical protein